MPENISLKKTSGVSYEIYFKNKLLGNFTRDIDGFYYFWPYGQGGCWSEHSLRLIADSLHKLNADHEEHLKKRFNN